MKKFYILLPFFAILLVIASCKREGCTDCNAINYDEKAKSDDGSCEYINENRIGRYMVVDSMYDCFLNLHCDTYEIEIKPNPCKPYEMLISNYSNISNTLNEPLAVTCEISGNDIRINYQILYTSPDLDPYHRMEIMETEGYFSGDSIFFEMLYYYQYGDFNGGNCYGKKK